jgi:ribosomal protein L11 methyltransferase
VLEEGLAARVDASKPAVVRGYLAADQGDPEAAVQVVLRDIGHLQAFELRHIGEVSTRLVHEEDWAEAWKQHFPVMRVGHHMVIQPTWRDYSSEPDDIVIKLDPGQAFGTGLHPTTRLCLEGIEAWHEQDLLGDARVLDVGTGSGILAIACAKLGGSVLAVDIDPLSIETTIANAALNGLSDVIRTQQGSLPLPEPRQFHLVVANLIAGVLIDIADELYSSVWPDGRLLASGIFNEREAEVLAAFDSAGFRVIGRRVDGDWIALEATRGV